MAMHKTVVIKNVDEYIKQFPENVQASLQKIRNIIKTAAPKAEEVISYMMPAYKFNGMLVYFAGYKNHIGFYAAPTGHEAFKKELAIYKSGKGSVQFPLDKPLPVSLISKIVKYRVAENLEKGKTKSVTARISKK